MTTPNKEDKALFDKLTDEEKEFYLKFNEEFYDDNPQTEWGRERRSARRKDIYSNSSSVDYFRRYYLSAYLPNFDNAVNREIDLERGACGSNDLEPGLIRTAWGFRCSVWTPDGYERRSFMTEEAARQWLYGIKDKYKDYVYETY